MSYIDLSRHVVDWLLKIGQWGRAVSVDIEADLATLDKPTRIPLSVAVARRTNKQIEVKKFILNEETTADEVRTVSELGTELQRIRPLAMIGWNIRQFDQMILGLKLRQLDNLFKQKKEKPEPWYWALRDAFVGSYVLDVMDPCKFEIGAAKLEDAIAHPRFQHLKFKNTKHIVSSRMKANQSRTKWDVIHDLWKNDRKLFEQYIEGDVHDTLLIAEDLFCLGMK
ncbi:MAG: hypothetical protein WCC94_10350 [Candidatus Bathyarchaeia archaeon]